MNQEINLLAEISSPFKRTLVIRQRIYSLAGENEIALVLYLFSPTYLKWKQCSLTSRGQS